MHRKLSLFLMLVLLIVLSSSKAWALSFTVDTTLDEPDINPGDGLCITSSGKCSLRAAVQEIYANLGTNSIDIPEGTYTLDTTYGSLPGIYSSVTISGAGSKTLIDMNGLHGFYINSSYWWPGNLAATFQNMTIKNAIYSGISGGYYNYYTQGPINIQNIHFENNTSTYGGGINIDGGQTANISNSTFTHNTSSNDGGAIMGGNYSNLSITNCNFDTNQAASTGGDVASGGTLNISDSSFTGSIASGGGGSVSVLGGLPATITRASIGNGSSGVGGAIYMNYGSSLNLINSTLSNNTAASISGAIFMYNSNTLNITGSTISGNSGGRQGGAFYAPGGSTINLTNSTFANNSASDRGGAIFNGGATININNVTFANNSIPSSGQGGAIWEASSNHITLRNSILAGNSASGGGPDCYGSLISAGYNLIQDMTSCTLTGDNTGNQTGFSSEQIGLNPLADNGGPTYTLALAPTSIAIAAGNPSGCTDGSDLLSTDQRGDPRPAGVICDAGAFEFQFSRLAFSSANYSANAADGSVTLTVTRSSSGDGSASVHYATTDGTAIAGTDYVASSGSLTWAEGDTSDKTFTISLLNHNSSTTSKTLTVNLTDPSNGASLGNPNESIVNISFENGGTNDVPNIPPPASLTFTGSGDITQRIPLTNTENQTIYIVSAHIEGENFLLENCNGVSIPPGETYYIEVSYQGLDKINESANLILEISYQDPSTQNTTSSQTIRIPINVIYNPSSITGGGCSLEYGSDPNLYVFFFLIFNLPLLLIKKQRLDFAQKTH